MKCIVKNCENHSHQGDFVGELCSPCYEWLAERNLSKKQNSQAWRNELHDPKPESKLQDKILKAFIKLVKDRVYDMSVYYGSIRSGKDCLQDFKEEISIIEQATGKKWEDIIKC